MSPLSKSTVRPVQQSMPAVQVIQQYKLINCSSLFSKPIAKRIAQVIQLSNLSKLSKLSNYPRFPIVQVIRLAKLSNCLSYPTVLVIQLSKVSNKTLPVHQGWVFPDHPSDSNCFQCTFLSFIFRNRWYISQSPYKCKGVENIFRNMCMFCQCTAESAWQRRIRLRHNCVGRVGFYLRRLKQIYFTSASRLKMTLAYACY